MFKEYQSKPVICTARKIQATDVINKVEGTEATYLLTAEEAGTITFKAYELPEVGDYVVYLRNDDIYHCSAGVFGERNTIPAGE